jgi:hypothetical protein
MKTAVALVTLSLITGAVFAGTKFNNNVTFFGNSFQGSFGTVRNSADSTQLLYCQRRNAAANCWARDVNGIVRSCTTSDPEHLAMIDSLTSSSNLYATYNADGTCGILLHRVGSVNEPLK